MSVHSAREARIIAADSGKNWKSLGCRGFELLVMEAAVPRFQLVPAYSFPPAAPRQRETKNTVGMAAGQRGVNAAKQQTAIGMLNSLQVPIIRNSPVLILLN